jgi:hypothetical protein
VGFSAADFADDGDAFWVFVLEPGEGEFLGDVGEGLNVGVVNVEIEPPTLPGVVERPFALLLRLVVVRGL